MAKPPKQASPTDSVQLNTTTETQRPRRVPIKIIQEKCIEYIKPDPDGKRFSDIYSYVFTQFPDAPDGTVRAAIRDLIIKFPDQIYKADKGLYKHNQYLVTQDENLQTELPEATPVPAQPTAISESDFYSSFADWLVDDLEECTKAISVGGNKFGGKWGTPDVVGILKPKESDIIKYTTEIITAEIKLEPRELITAFGQSCAYRLFSHKVYLVIPEKSSSDDKSRLDSLCSIFSIGLITFNSNDPTNPNYTIINRASKQEPDYYYVNKNIKLLEDSLFA